MRTVRQVLSKGEQAIVQGGRVGRFGGHARSRVVESLFSELHSGGDNHVNRKWGFEPFARTDAHGSVRAELEGVGDPGVVSRRVPCVLDLCTREALAIEVDVSLPGARVVAVMVKSKGGRDRRSWSW